MASSVLIRFGGLVAMVGSVVFVLVLLLRPMLNAMLAEAVTLPMFFLLVVTVSVAIVSVAALLRGTRHGKSGTLASGGSLVGVVLVFVGLLMGFVGIFVIPLGVLVATGGLVVLAILTARMNALPWWGSPRSRRSLLYPGPSSHHPASRFSGGSAVVGGGLRPLPSRVTAVRATISGAVREAGKP